MADVEEGQQNKDAVISRENSQRPASVESLVVSGTLPAVEKNSRDQQPREYKKKIDARPSPRRRPQEPLHHAGIMSGWKMVPETVIEQHQQTGQAAQGVQFR